MNTVFPDPADTKFTPEMHTIYRTKLGRLLFLAALIHSDVLFATNYFSRRAMSYMD